MLFHVVAVNMVVKFYFAFELVDNCVYPLGFVIESYYVRLGDVFFAFVRFVYMVQKICL